MLNYFYSERIVILHRAIFIIYAWILITYSCLTTSECILVFGHTAHRLHIILFLFFFVSFFFLHNWYIFRYWNRNRNENRNITIMVNESANYIQNRTNCATANNIHENIQNNDNSHLRSSIISHFVLWSNLLTVRQRIIWTRFLNAIISIV